MSTLRMPRRLKVLVAQIKCHAYCGWKMQRSVEFTQYRVLNGLSRIPTLVRYLSIEAEDGKVFYRDPEFNSNYETMQRLREGLETLRKTARL